MQTPNKSSPTFPTSPLAANSPNPYLSTSQCTDTMPAGLIADLSPTHSEHSVAPPNSPVRPPPMDSLFTTGDSDCSDSSEGEPESGGQVGFSSFHRARAKKRLEFNDVTKKRARPKRVDPVSVHSETQRMIRESRIKIPDYQPPVISLQDVIRKLPKLTKPVTNSDTFVPPSAPPVFLPTQTTSTPFLKRVPLSACDEADELPDIDFTSEQPIQRLELTTFAEQTDKCIPIHNQHNPTPNQPTLSLPNDFTHLNLAPSVTNSLEAFKSRFIHHSLPPPKASPAVSESAETADPLLPPDALSALSQKPGAVHIFLRERLRRSLMAKRVQEHEDMKMRLRFENEEYIPSEGSCSEAEDIGKGKETGMRNDGDEESQPGTVDENNVSDNNQDTTSSSSESETSDGDSSDSEEGEESMNAPNLKAKRQEVIEDSDTGDEDNRLNTDSIGDPTAVNFEDKDSQPLQINSISQFSSEEPIHSPDLSQSILIETSNHGLIADGNRKESQDSSLINSSLNYLPYLDKFHASNAEDTFKIPLAFQLPHSQSQSSIPEDLKDLCDPTQDGEGEDQLPFICSGRFTQATQEEAIRSDDVARLSPVAAADSSQLDETVDADMPVLPPRKMRLKDQLRLKRYRQLAEFEEREAEVSGSDPEFEGSECGSEFGDELDEYESEEGDIDAVESEEVERLNAKYYNRVMLEDDEANMELLKEKFLPEQAIMEDGLRMKNGLFRKRKFNFGDDDMCSSGTCEWDEDGREPDTDQLVTQERRRRRVEREEYIARKSASSISDLAYGDTRTLPLVDKPSIVLAISCEHKSTGLVIPSIKKSLGKHNSLLTRNFSTNSSKLDSNFLSDSSNDSKIVGRKTFVFQSTRSLEGMESSSVPSLSKSASVPTASSSAIKKGHNFKKKIQPDLKKEITFLKPDSSVFHLLNVN